MRCRTIRVVLGDDLPDFDLAAAGLRADGRDTLGSVEVLARKLEDALPGRTRVDRRSVRFLSREKRVARIDVDLGETTYALTSDGRNVAGTRGQAVRGVTIKRDELSLEAWVQRLTDDLRKLAGSSNEARTALQQILGA
jgi:hypothetical protein